MRKHYVSKRGTSLWGDVRNKEEPENSGAMGARGTRARHKKNKAYDHAEVKVDLFSYYTEFGNYW